MIMSFWPTSLQVMENKKNGESEHKAEQIQRDEDGGPLQSKTKGEQKHVLLKVKGDNRRARRKSKNAHVCVRAPLFVTWCC